MPEVDLPLNLSAPAATSANTASVLVIDDEAAIRDSLEVLLTLEGYAVKMAGGRRAGPQDPGARKLRPGAAGPGAAGTERAGTAAHDQRAAAGSSRHHDHRLRHGGQRGGGDPGGRGELCPEAVGQREAAGGHSIGGGAAQGRRREPAAQAHPQAALQLHQHRGQERHHAARIRPGGAGGAQPLDGADPGRERHGQGADRQGAFTPTRRAATSRLCPSTPGPCRRSCWSPRCSAT